MSLQIKVPSRLDTKTTIKIMLIFICFERLFEAGGFPHGIIFLLDIGNIFLWFNLVYNQKLDKIFTSNMVKIHILIFLIGITIALINRVKILLMIWALRNLFRFYIFFGACVLYLRLEDIVNIYILLNKIFYLNAVIIAIQFVMGYRQDWLGGLFGSVSGANAYSNVFILIVCTYNIAKGFEQHEDSAKAFGIVLISFAIAVVTETKVFFFEIVAIIILTVIIIGIVERKYKIFFTGAIIVVAVAIGVLVGAEYVGKLYVSKSNADFLSIEGLKYILTRESGYTGFGDLNRLTAIGSINKLEFFKDSIFNRIFGMGLGAAEYSSSITALKSDFYFQYEYLHYYWFSHAWMYLECGYLGLIGYIVGFFSNIPYGIKLIRVIKKNRKDASVIITGIILSIMTLLLCIYNQSLRMESAYLLYFGFAAIYVGGREIYGKK